MAVDEVRGRVAVVGTASQSVNGLLWSGSQDVVLASLDASTGQLLYARQFGTPSVDYGRGVAVDGAGRVYVTGYTGGQLDGQANAGRTDMFLACYNLTTGTPLWTALLGTSAAEDSLAVAVDLATRTEVYMAGYTEATNTGSGLAGTSGFGGLRDAVVARYGSSGARTWVRQLGTSGEDIMLAVAVFQSEVYAAGVTAGSMASGTANAGGMDVFLVKLTASQGAVVWSVQLGTDGNDSCQGLAVDLSFVYLVSSRDQAVVRYSRTGNRSNSLGGGRARRIALDSAGDVLMASLNDSFVTVAVDDAGIGWRATGSPVLETAPLMSLATEAASHVYVASTLNASSGIPGGPQLSVSRWLYGCASGYAGNGILCDNLDECALSTHNCHSNATCSDSVGSFLCACRVGYSGSGVGCSNVNECALGLHNCHVNATCTDTQGSFTCACFGSVGNGTSCSGFVLWTRQVSRF